MEPQHPVGPAFDRASDKTAAWRKQQEVALSEQQRKEYRRMEQTHNDALRKHSAQFYEKEPELREAEKKRLMREKPTLALRMLPTERLREAEAYRMARGNVMRQHEVGRAGLEQRQQQERDGFLRDAAQERAEQERSKAAPDLQAIFRARAQQKENEKERSRGDEGRERSR